MGNRASGSTQQLQDILADLARSRSDEQAWRSLYLLMWPFVFGSVYRSLRGQPQLAEDASQEVFLRLLRYCPFDRLGDPAAFKAYLHSVCRNVARDYVRRILGRAEEVLTDELAEPTAGRQILSPEEIALLRRRLDEVLRQLDAPDQRLVLLLAEGYTYAEIARQTSLTEGNVAVRLHRIRGRLFKYLQNKDL